MEMLYEERWYQKREKEAILAKTTRWYRYHPNRIQLVPVPIQVALVPPCRTCLVPIPNRVVPVPHCLNAQIFVFLYI